MLTTKPQVSLIRATSYQQDALKESLTTLLDPLGGIGAFVKPGNRVLLKPNLLMVTQPTKECTTRPELIRAVAQQVIEAGGKPFLGDSPGFGTAKGVARANGLLPILEELNIPIVEFRGQRYTCPEGSGKSYEFNHLLLSKEAMETDVIINLPKVKSHVQLTVTMGVKNLFGCVPGKMKAWWHMEAGKDAKKFGQMLVETARAINPSLTILDGIIGHEGNGPIYGEPRELGVLGASENVFALDRAVLEILKVDPMQVPTMVAAQNLGICPELTDIEFPHLSPNLLQIEDWRLPDNLMPIDFAMPRVIKSTFKHLYIRFIKEPMGAYSRG